MLSENARFTDAHLVDGTILTNIHATRFQGYDTTIWFVGEDEHGDEFYFPPTAVIYLRRAK